MSHTHRIICITNNYSYFKQPVVEGPKSLIALLVKLRDHGFEVRLLVPASNSCGAFPDGITVSDLTFLSALKAAAESSIILCDRENLLKSILLSVLFRKKLVVRMLGLGRRLGSKRVFSLRSIYSAATRCWPPDLLISTIDGSYDPELFPIMAKISRHRINGVQKLNSAPPADFDALSISDKFFFVGRSAEEKGVLDAIRYFNALGNPRFELHLFGPSESPPSMLLSQEETDRLFFYGFVSRASIEKFLPRLDIMISANKLGCLGNAELEAISFGKPIIYLGNKDHIQFIPEALRHFYLNPQDYKKYGNTKPLSRREADCGDFESVHNADVVAIAQLL